MKKEIFNFTCLALGIYFSMINIMRAEGLSLPDDDPLIQKFLNTPNPPAPTPEELAIPPVGEIRKIHLRAVNQIRDLMAVSLASIPAGEQGLGSPWYTKIQAYKAGLDAVAASRLQTDCFALIPVMSEILVASRLAEDRPENANQHGGFVNDFSTTLVNAIERHLIDNNGNVSTENLAKFVTFFTLPGFRSEGDWEKSPIPVDAPGIMILDAAAVVTRLKTRPWQEAEQFLGNNTATEAFARYAVSGDGMAVLKTKYAADQATITAKWNELAAWVETQRPPN